MAYTFACVRNAAVEVLRRTRRPRDAPLGIFASRQPDPAAAAIASERGQLVRRAVEALEPDQQQAVVLRLYAGLSFRQIAEALGEPLQTIASRYRRALERIRNAIGEFI